MEPKRRRTRPSTDRADYVPAYTFEDADADRSTDHVEEEEEDES